MREKSSIKERIIEYLEYKGLSKYKFYKDTGVARGVLDKKHGIGEETITKFLEYAKEVDVRWLINEEGYMLKSDNLHDLETNKAFGNKDSTGVVEDTNLLNTKNNTSQEAIIADLKKELTHKDKLITVQEDMISFLKKEVERLKGSDGVEKRGSA